MISYINMCDQRLYMPPVLGMLQISSIINSATNRFGATYS